MGKVKKIFHKIRNMPKIVLKPLVERASAGPLLLPEMPEIRPQYPSPRSLREHFRISEYSLPSLHDRPRHLRVCNPDPSPEASPLPQPEIRSAEELLYDGDVSPSSSQRHVSDEEAVLKTEDEHQGAAIVAEPRLRLETAVKDPKGNSVRLTPIDRQQSRPAYFGELDCPPQAQEMSVPSTSKPLKFDGEREIRTATVLFSDFNPILAEDAPSVPNIQGPGYHYPKFVPENRQESKIQNSDEEDSAPLDPDLRAIPTAPQEQSLTTPQGHTCATCLPRPLTLPSSCLVVPGNEPRDRLAKVAVHLAIINGFITKIKSRTEETRRPYKPSPAPAVTSDRQALGVLTTSRRGVRKWHPLRWPVYDVVESPVEEDEYQSFIPPKEILTSSEAVWHQGRRATKEKSYIVYRNYKRQRFAQRNSGQWALFIRKLGEVKRFRKTLDAALGDMGTFEVEFP